MFTQKCFIRKNTPELVKKLEELGYKALFSARNGYGEYYLDEMCQSVCEVIGNIHDNKELLK